MIPYAGIGSRRTPPEILDLMTRLARVLAQQGWLLRSGHAQGADQAFERGAGPRAQVFLPWPTFESEILVEATWVESNPSDQAYEIAAQHHPRWDRLGRGARALHARNVHQILGSNLSEKVWAVICWTPDGSLDGRGPDTGGTGQALRIASAYPGISVVNMRLEEHLGWVVEYLEKHERTAA